MPGRIPTPVRPGNGCCIGTRKTRLECVRPRLNGSTHHQPKGGTVAMKRLTPFLLLAALAVLLAAPAGAQSNSVEWRTPLRLSEPTEIPGTVLQPGSYLVKVL